MFSFFNRSKAFLVKNKDIKTAAQQLTSGLALVYTGQKVIQALNLGDTTTANENSPIGPRQ